VYFLHNKTAGLESFCQKIKAGIPHLNVSYAHGKMSSKSLEKTILSFFDGGVDVLVCTTIIESGLDVPKANTIIINNAQDFGLAQLYQIRGRVGRGDVQAYCYLCVPKKGGLSSEAFQRLSAIEHYSALGSAYSIATKDLEIRGAGNLFGYEQSGQISRVGLEMFNKILSSAVRRRRNPRKNQENNKELPSVVFSGVAYFGKQRMPLVRDRIYFYEQLSRARTVDQLKKIKDEVVDRFGRLSLKEENLFAITEIQCRLYPHPFSKCVITNSKISFFLSGLPQGLDGSSFFEQMSRVLSKTTPPHKINSAHDEQLQLSFSIKSEQEGLAFGKKFDRLFSVIISG
jgi:transcription-repair coupling factor (superfamily II helicase)